MVSRSSEPILKHLDLSDVEIELLLRVCRKYRSSIPIYLQSGKAERDLLDEIAKKLESRLSPASER